MRIGMVGLGKMGMNMTRRLLGGGHEVVAFDISAANVKQAKKHGAIPAGSFAKLVELTGATGTVWVMVPSGKPVDDTIDALAGLMKKGATIIDGGNSFYKDAIRHEAALRERGINFMDAGVSGGIWGITAGYCLMVGGSAKSYKKHVPVFRTLAPKDGYLHCGPVGAGHFVKMVHNGIEYGMMAAYGEGFDILQSSRYADTLDFAKVSHLWNQGSVVRSWLLELAEDAFAKDPKLARIEPYVEDSGEGRWTLAQAVESGVPAPVIAAALFQRFASRGQGDFSDRLLAALRNEFGGHAVKKTKG